MSWLWPSVEEDRAVLHTGMSSGRDKLVKWQTSENQHSGNPKWEFCHSGSGIEQEYDLVGRFTLLLSDGGYAYFAPLALAMVLYGERDCP